MSIITENKKLENKALTQDGRRLDNTPQFPCRLESEKTLPPAIQQFYAIGYSVGDYVCGRCYHKDKNTVEWEGYLTDSDIDLYRMKPTGEYDENRDRVWKRQEHHPQGLSFLKKINNQGYDIFFSVNGGRNNNAVDRVKAFIFESDTASVPEQLAMINEFPIKPSLVVYTGGKSLHTYYAISGDCSKEDWQRTQECLTLATNSDPAIKDLPRLFRLAGFNHQKSGNTSEIKVINSVSYTHSEVSTAIEQYYPDAKCPRLYNLYKYVALINASKDYPDLPSDYAYKCETIAERGEELTRLKKYTKLLRQGKTTEAEDLLNTPLKDLVDRFEEERQEWKERASKTYHIRTVPSEGDTLSTVTGTLASRFCEGFNLEGRAEYHTCRCPVHKGESEDSLHIHKESGGLKCQSGCDSIEVEEELRRLAREKGDPLADCSFAKYETSPHLEKIKKSLKLSGKKSAKRYVNDLEDMAKVQDSRLVVIKSPMNTGKTYAINQQVNQSDNPVLATTHRRLLTRELCRKFGIPYIEDEGAKKSPSKGLCIHSWHEFGQAQFSPEQARDSVIVIDEVDQTLWELVAGKTIKNRSFIVQNLRESLRLAKQVWVASAHVTQWEVNFLQRLTDEDPLIIENTYKPAKEAGAEVNVLSKLEQFYPRLENDLEDGKQIICFVPGQKEESTFSTTVLAEHYKERYPNKRIGAVDGETVYEPGHEMFALPEKLQDDPEFLNQFDLLLCTLVINTGISLEHTTFDAVYCHGGTYANSEELAQAMMRVRKFDVPRYILRDPNVHGSVVAKGAETPREVYDYLTKKRDKVLNEINRATNPWEGDLFNYSPDDGVFE